MTISSIGHALLLGWGLVSFAPTPLQAPVTESMPVDLVPISEVTELKAGKRNAPKLDEAKQAAEKVGEAKPAPETEKKNERPPVQTAAAPPPPAAEPKPEPTPEPKKEQPKPEAKPETVNVPTPPRKLPPRPRQDTANANTPKQRNFDPDKIAALLDRREPQRRAATADEISRMASLGTAAGAAARLTQSEIDALRAQIQACWNPPIGAANAQDLVVLVRIQFRPDGNLSREPQLLNRSGDPYFQVAAESAMRAVRRCQPYTLPAAKYDVWKDVEVTFDPRDMFGG